MNTQWNGKWLEPSRWDTNWSDADTGLLHGYHCQSETWISFNAEHGISRL